MTYEEKSEIVIRQLREDRDRLQNAIDGIRAEIESEIIHWRERRSLFDNDKIDFTGTPPLEGVNPRNPNEISCVRYSARIEGLEKALEVIDKYRED